MKVDRIKIHAKFSGHCAYCGIVITVKEMQVDHVTARFRFGTNDPENLYPACRSCNNWKHSFTVDEFRNELQSQIDRLRKYSSPFRISERFGLVKANEKRILFWFERYVIEDSNEAIEALEKGEG